MEFGGVAAPGVAPGALAGANGPVCVLVADDDPTSRLLVGAALDGHIGGLTEAENGWAAVQALERQDFDVAIVDLDMPVMDGFGVIERARAQPRTRHLPIIVITGRDDVVAIERAFALGATSFLCKPINWAVFRHQVSYVLQVARAERETRAAKERAETLAQSRQRSLTALAKAIRNGAAPSGDNLGGTRLLAVLDRVTRADAILAGAAGLDLQPTRARVLAEAAIQRVAAMLGDAATARIISSAGPHLVLCDRELAVVALSEILINALVYSPADQPVRLAAVEAAPDRIRFEIEDRGAGIPDHVLESGTDPTQSAQAVSGVGLGLATARAIVAQHGGHFGILSEIARGTEAFLSFPAAHAEHGEGLLKKIAQMSGQDFPE